MAKSGRNVRHTDDGNGHGPEGQILIHPQDLKMRVTNDLHLFSQTTHNSELSGSIYVRDAALKRSMGTKFRSAFQATLKQDYDEKTRPMIFNVAVATGGIADVSNIPGPFHKVAHEIRDFASCDTPLQNAPAHLFVMEDINILKKAQHTRHFSLLMMHWTTAGTGALSQQLILPEGDWGYFQSDAAIPMAPFDKKNSSLFFVLMPK